MLNVSLLGGLGVTNPYSRDTATTTTEPPKPITAQIGDCARDNLGGEYVWTLGASGTPQWQRKPATYVCPRYVPMDIIRQTGLCTKETPQYCSGGIYKEPALVMNLGPWTIPLPRQGNSYTWLLDDYSKLPPELAAQIGKQLQTPIQSGYKTPQQVGYWNGQLQSLKDGSQVGPPESGITSTYTFPDGASAQTGSYLMTTPQGTYLGTGNKDYRVAPLDGGTETITWPTSAPWGPYLSTRGWLDRLGIWGKVIDGGYMGGLGDPSLCGGRSEYACSTSGSTADRITPVLKFKHPETNEDWGVWMTFAPVGPAIPSVAHTFTRDGQTVTLLPASTQSVALRLMVQKVPEDPWYKGVLQVLFYIPTKIFDLAIATVQEIVNLSCGDPNKALTAATAAGPGAVAAVNAALALCPAKPPNAPMPTETAVNETTGKKRWPWLWIAGGATALGLLTLLLLPPKKQAA